MPEYKSPLRDIRYAMNEVLDFPGHYASLPGCEAATPDMVDAILEEAAAFVDNEVAPLHQVGHEQGCQWDDGKVTTPDGFKKAWDLYVENGWAGLSQPEEFGGQGLPPSLSNVFGELINSANHAWALYPSLTWGAIRTADCYAADDIKATYLPPMAEGRFSGTMCLTESNAGSDLGLLRTKATPNDDGSYSITGSKIFITSGEHDLSENIVHIVLARLPDAPEGVKGISLFLVPKLLVNDDGSIGEPNGVTCGSIEHKMGINGSATCVLNFDGAKGYLLGEPNRGMRQMFTFINESRLMVAQQGHAAMERAYQGAVEYARERLQMRAPVRIKTDKPADPIIVHPDVRRMLLTQRALSEGVRLLVFYCAQQVDITHSGTDEQRERAETVLALLTPIVKGFSSEVANEAASYGIQIFGGHGYVAEWGMEQIARDARITSIYEGTTGIQALDLLARKVLATEGTMLEPFLAEIKAFVAESAGNAELQPMLDALDKNVDEWIALTKEIGASAMKNPDEVNAAAFDYLMFAGYVSVAYFLARSAAVALVAERNAYYHEKIDNARFYFERLLPRTLTLATTIRSGEASIADIA